jgi:hypothetical protein
MPLVKVSRRVGHSPAENRRLLGAIHEALVEAFKIPAGDRLQQLLELDAAHFEIPAERGPAFTLVEIIGRRVRRHPGAAPRKLEPARRCLVGGPPARLQARRVGRDMEPSTLAPSQPRYLALNSRLVSSISFSPSMYSWYISTGSPAP